MQTLGERLEEARKRKGSSIREAAEATKIRGDYLQKFEANTFDLALPPLYLRGFLRAYARYLALDPARTLAEFDDLAAAAGRAPRREARENFGHVELGDRDSASTAGRAAGLDPLLLKYGLIGGGALGVILLVVLLVNLFTPATPAKKSAGSAASLTAESTAPAATLTFTALDTVRIKLAHQSDGREIFQGTLARGETRSFAKTGPLFITVEDRSKLRMELNGRLLDWPPFLAGQGQGNYGRFALD